MVAGRLHTLAGQSYRLILAQLLCPLRELLLFLGQLPGLRGLLGHFHQRVAGGQVLVLTERLGRALGRIGQVGIVGGHLLRCRGKLFGETVAVGIVEVAHRVGQPDHLHGRRLVVLAQQHGAGATPGRRAAQGLTEGLQCLAARVDALGHRIGRLLCRLLRLRQRLLADRLLRDAQAPLFAPGIEALLDLPGLLRWRRQAAQTIARNRFALLIGRLFVGIQRVGKRQNVAIESGRRYGWPHDQQRGDQHEDAGGDQVALLDVPRKRLGRPETDHGALGVGKLQCRHGAGGPHLQQFDRRGQALPQPQAQIARPRRLQDGDRSQHEPQPQHGKERHRQQHEHGHCRQRPGD